MNTTVQPYLYFDGCCEAAIEFYRTNLDADVQVMMRYKESPEPLPSDQVPDGYEEKILHATMVIGESTVMLSDSGSGGEENRHSFSGFSLSLSFTEEAEAKRAYKLLAEGGDVHMPLGRTFWSPCFGMLADRFGVGWMINVVPGE